jgi:hypothetical protein
VRITQLNAINGLVKSLDSCTAALGLVTLSLRQSVVMWDELRKAESDGRLQRFSEAIAIEHVVDKIPCHSNCAFR